MEELKWRFIFIFFLGLFCNYLYSQSFDWTDVDFPGSLFREVLAKNDSLYGFVTNSTLDDINVEYKIVRYSIKSEPGESDISLDLEQKVLFPENYSTLALEYINSTGLWLAFQSSFISPGRYNLRAVLFNDDFEILSERSVDTLGYPLIVQIDSDSSYSYVLGFLLGPPKNEVVYLKYFHSNPHELPGIEIRQTEPSPLFLITSMNVDPRTGNLLVFSTSGITVLDTNLYKLEDYNASVVFTHDHGEVLGTGNYYYSHGARDTSWDNGHRKLVLHKYDTNFQILIADTLGWSGQDNYPFIEKSIDYLNNQLLIGGHLAGPYSHPDFFTHNKKFYMAKYDLDLNQIWYREFGGDRPYTFLGLKLGEDGSGFAYGYFIDSIDQERYAYIMHVDENGEILTSTTIPDQTSSIKVINPGHSLQVLNPDGLDAQIILYDLNGCELFRKDLDGGLTEIPTASLPEALYPYVILSDNVYHANGKWMKINE